MITKRLSKTLVLSAGVVIALSAFGASEVFGKQARGRSSTTASSQSRGGSTATRSGSTATRSGGGGSRGAASTRTSRGGKGGGGHYGGRGRYGGHSYHYGVSLGYYGWGGWGWGGYFYSPFYYGYPVYYSYRPERFEDFGALDLNVHPKKTEVWIDGQYVGTAGRFDGYPGYLWLEDGPHELILFRQGKESVSREVNVLAGNVLDIMVDMLPGEATPAEQLTSFTPEELRKRREMAEYREQRDQIERPERVNRTERTAPGAERAPDRRDVREEPGRLTLAIDPTDASIYLDGRFLGTGGELARLHSGLIVSPGEHTLEVVRPGFDSQNVPFSIQTGEETMLEIALNTG